MEEQQNKELYYIPDLSEFHIDFEYEFDYTTLLDYEVKGRTWGKVTLTENILEIGQDGDIEDENPFYKPMKCFRVKYLDKEDIESLGFKSVNIDYKVHDIFILNNFKLYLSNKDAFNICKFVTIETINKSRIRFHGLVQNKSELKKLLIQIGVNTKNNE